MDVVARVAAISPVIRFKDASPFFMLEVEQAEEESQQDYVNCSKDRSPESNDRSAGSAGFNRRSTEPEPRWVGDGSSSSSIAKTSAPAEGGTSTRAGIAGGREEHTRKRERDGTSVSVIDAWGWGRNAG